MDHSPHHIGISVLGVLLLLGLGPRHVYAHCDTTEGPVVADARAALQNGDATPVLKWVKKADEAQVVSAFKKALVVRAQGPEARDLADSYFFETLVRIHRAGEGAPFTGLKPSGAIDPALRAADQALESGTDEAVVKMITETVAIGIRERFMRAAAAKTQAHRSVEAGRAFVASYIEFTHYVERLSRDAAGKTGHNGEQSSNAESEHAGHR